MINLKKVSLRIVIFNKLLLTTVHLKICMSVYRQKVHVDVQVCISHVCICHACINHACICRMCINHVYISHVHIGHVCMNHIHIGQMCISIICIGHVCIDHVCVGHMCTGYLCIGHACIGHVVGSMNSCSHQTWAHLGSLSSELQGSSHLSPQHWNCKRILPCSATSHNFKNLKGKLQKLSLLFLKVLQLSVLVFSISPEEGSNREWIKIHLELEYDSKIPNL